MTLGTIFRSVLGPSSALLSTAGHSHKLLSERTSDYYHYGSHKHHKGKSKSDKKHAILSALTLLAFLFFLNILQNCIREQNGNRGTMMMLAPTGGATAPTGHEAKDPNQDLKSPDNPLRKKRSTDEESGRKSRTLLGLQESAGDRRQVKFIRNFSSVNNWTKELSQLSEKDLDEQKLKTLNFPLYWKNNRFASVELRPTAPSGMNGSKIIRRFKKRERTSVNAESTQATVTGKPREYKKSEKFQPSPYIPENPKLEPYLNRAQNNSKQNATASTPGQSHMATTPRIRRSDYSTPRPGDYDDYAEQIREDAPMSPTPAVGLDLNTFQTFPVYNYYNHRPYKENEVEDIPESTTPEIDRMHADPVRVTTQQPLFHPTRTPGTYTRPHYPKHRNRHPVLHGHHHLRNHYAIDSRYRYSPYRKTGAYEAPHFHDHAHDDYYPPVVLAKYEVQHDEPGFDLMKFLWAMVSSIAKPLTRLVPTFAKDNSDEAQCYDLLVCEAQRASRFMGPTAEALASTVGTLLTWAATEDTRQIVVDAINSGRDNTCQQQIKDCEARSGGKSAMTVIAQVLEMRLR